jgi:trans-aconitate 2-methyltransferase
MWDPAQYQRYTDQRSRPFFELLSRVGAVSPGYIADLGCGPGNLTLALAERWPDADVEGVDNSAEMLEAAEAVLASRQRLGGTGSLSFHRADVRDFVPGRKPGVIVCNAVLQWVPGHQELLPRWAGLLAEDGWLAVQVPANYDQPSHQILRELAASPRWRDALTGVSVTRQSAQPQEYLDVLGGAGYEVDAWETTYLHVLQGEDPVLDWYMGTGLRPVIAALPPGQAAAFAGEYGERLRAAYPARGYGTVLPFRRVFAVARKR